MTLQIGRKIGGRGQAGDTNVVASEDGFSFEEAERQLRDVNLYLGEYVVLAGGGSPKRQIAVLQAAELKDYGDGYKVRAVLTDPDGGHPIHANRNDAFTPWLDSWQLFRLEPKEVVS